LGFIHCRALACKASKIYKLLEIKQDIALSPREPATPIYYAVFPNQQNVRLFGPKLTWGK